MTDGAFTRRQAAPRVRLRGGSILSDGGENAPRRGAVHGRSRTLDSARCAVRPARTPIRLRCASRHDGERCPISRRTLGVFVKRSTRCCHCGRWSARSTHRVQSGAASQGTSLRRDMIPRSSRPRTRHARSRSTLGRSRIICALHCARIRASNSSPMPASRGRRIEPAAVSTSSSRRKASIARDPLPSVVNAVWANRPAVDQRYGLTPRGRWIIRRKLGVNLLCGRAPDALASFTVMLGPFGDVVSYRSGRVYLSWYPACMIGTTTGAEETDWNAVLGGVDFNTVRRETIDALARICPAVGNLEAIAGGETVVNGGSIFALGETDIDDPGSQLHERLDTGVDGRGAYLSVDTAKFTLAPCGGGANRRPCNRARRRPYLMMTAVTVCVPVFNAAVFLAETLDSIAAQSFADIKVLISLDRSDDDSESICRRYLHDRRFELIVQRERLGWVGNVNALIERVDTPYFCITPHDDLLAPQYLAEVYALAASDPAIACAYSDVQGFGTSSPVLRATGHSRHADRARHRLPAQSLCRSPVPRASSAAATRTTDPIYQPACVTTSPQIPCGCCISHCAVSCAACPRCSTPSATTRHQSTPHGVTGRARN